MDDFKQTLVKNGFKGELDDSAEAKEKYSHDASMFELVPKLVVMPKDSADVQTLIKLVASKKKAMPELSVTARSAGTDMAGGAINESVIVDFNAHFNKVERVTATEAQTQPGVFYRDFEAETLKLNALMPSYPASRDLCTVGGMVANNSGGEKSLEYGKVKDFVKELRVVFADGNEYTVKPIKKNELDRKMAQKDYEGAIYKKIYDLCEQHYDDIKAAKPQVSKNSMGYTLWEVWDRETGIFDLTKLIVGSEGTLGFVTDITYRLVPHRAHSGLLVLFLKDIGDLGELIPAVLKHKPATFECFDQATLLLTIRFMPAFLKMLGFKRFVHLVLSLIPDAAQLLHGIPKMVLMVEFNGETEDEVRRKVHALHKELAKYRARYEINGFEEDPTEGKSEKFWIMRRYAFQILRKKVKDKHTAPYIDDFIVRPEYLVEFLPRLRKLIKKYKLFATIQGHIGDGNFHVIPLMRIEDPRERKKIEPSQKEVNDLVLKYKGSLSGEHNDGLVRGPWLEAQFGKKIVGLFREVKDIFDPMNIFNPRKKSDADWDYSYSHIRDHF
ncbi:MAG TPA: FAD-binding oxidoreductase [Candidatus Saccharimonadales bacterium]|nr:FAD-binding oxidoreductase [Candidatus Saccharimonadales bacterium]